MPDIHYGGDSFPVDIESDPWEPALPPHLQSLLGTSLPALSLASSETPNVLLPLHHLGRSRVLLIFLPLITSPRVSDPPECAENSLFQVGSKIQQSIHTDYENLASIGFTYTFLITTQSALELRSLIRPEPRQQFPGLSDPDLTVGKALGLPTFELHGNSYYEPLAIILRENAIEKIIYPIHNNPEGFAQWTFNWVRVRRPDLDFLEYNLERGAFTRKNST